MPRDIPLVGINLADTIQPNSDYYALSRMKSNSVTPTSLPVPADFGTSIGGRTYGFKTRRGRTYELGRIEAGEAELKVNNSDGLLDPNNTSSSLYPNVLPYRPVGIAAAYPITGNILNDLNLAPAIPFGAPTTYESSRLSVCANDGTFEQGVISNWYTTSGAFGLSVTDTTARTGTYSMQTGLNSWVYLDVPVVAGQQVTVSFWYKTTLGTGTGTMALYDGGVKDLSFSITGANTPTASVAIPQNLVTYTRLSATYTSTANKLTILFTSSPGISYDDIQVEFGATPTTNVTTGPKIYNLFEGFVERYPQTFQAPNRGEVNLVATDAIASMSQVGLTSPYLALVLQDTATALYHYPLSEPSGATSAANNSLYEQNPLVPYIYNKDVPIVFGDQSSQTGVPGSNTTCADLTFDLSVTNYQGTLLQNLSVNDITWDPNSAYTFSFWFNYDKPISTANGYWLFQAFSGNNARAKPAQNPLLYMQLNNSGISMTMRPTDNVATPNATTSAIYLAPKVWYFISGKVTRNAGGTAYTLEMKVNGSTTATTTLTTSVAATISQFNLQGMDPTFISKFSNFTISRGSINAANYYSIGSTALSGQTTGNRFKSMVNTYSGLKYLPYSAETGKSQMGYALVDGDSLTDAIQNISDTENGQWYVDGAGFVVFKDRHDRLQKLVPSITFGDGAGEVPYAGDDLVINFDPSYVINNVNITRQGGSTASVQDSNSVAYYYPRVYNRTTNSLEDSDTSEAAYFILSRYKDPHARPETLTLTPARNPAIWATCLNIEIGDLVRVNKRPLGASPISIDCFVERVEHEFDAQSGDWITKVILSPTIVYYWNLTSFSSATASSGTVNRLFARQDQFSNTLGMKTRFSLIAGQLLQYQRTNATPRTNLVYNPNFELNANGWTSAQTGGVTRSTAFAQSGTASGIITWSSSADSNAFTFNHTYATTGSYTMSAYVYVPTGSTLAGRTITLTQEGGTATVTSTTSTPATLVAATWVRVSQIVNVTVAGSANGVFRLSGTLSTAVGQTIYIDSVMEEKSGTLNTYFDGASEAAYWDSTINNSISIIPSQATYVEVINGNISGTISFTVPTVRVGTFTSTSSEIYRTTLAQDLEPDLGAFGTVSATSITGFGTEVRVEALHNFRVGDTVMLSGFSTAAFNTATPVTITSILSATGNPYQGFRFASTAGGASSAGTVRAAVLLSDSAMAVSGATKFWVNNEVLSGITSGNVLEITGRNTYGNNTSYAFSGTPIIAVADTPAGLIPNGTVVNEYLPNQLVSIPYTAPDPTTYNQYSILGSWVGSLSTGTYTTVTPASGIKYNTISLNALVDKDNYPASDLMSGQVINLNNGTTSELFAIVSTTAPAVGTGVWQATGYKVAATTVTVGTTSNVFAGDTSVVLSGSVTASAILIDGEFMQVTAGSGTNTLTVTRGTPDAAVWNVLTLSPHSSSTKIYTIVNAGLTGTYAAGNVVSEGIVTSTGTTSVYAGTARLGY
jgi:hypothetical protein